MVLGPCISSRCCLVVGLVVVEAVGVRLTITRYHIVQRLIALMGQVTDVIPAAADAA